LKELESEYGDLLYYSHVRWLSRGKFLERFFQLRTEICKFITEVKPNLTVGERKVTELLSDPGWLLDFAFLVDITGHLNVLNTRMQGRQALITELLDNVRAFCAKLELFKRQLEGERFDQFHAMKVILDELQDRSNVQVFVGHIQALSESFKARFKDVEGRETGLHLFRNPFSVAVDDYKPCLQLEILDLQSCPTLKEKFHEVSLVEFYHFLDRDKFPEILKVAGFWAVQFGSTYVCEQCFSIMKLTKSKHRSRLTNSHLDCAVRLALSPMTPEWNELVSKKRCQASSQ
jgi:hypothetical protein